MLIVITRKHQKRFDGSWFYEMERSYGFYVHTRQMQLRSTAYLDYITWLTVSDRSCEGPDNLDELLDG